MRNISKIALALALLGTSATASAAYPTYWSRHDYGNYSSYSGTRNGGWALGGEILNHYVYWGSIF